MRPTAVDEFFEEQEFERSLTIELEEFKKGREIIEKKGWNFARFRDYVRKVCKDYEIDEDKAVELYKQLCKEVVNYRWTVKEWVYDLRNIWDEN